MKTLKKNNKGFSLVELIVVILIMAIIAVALAPQVMKWVDKSKENADVNNLATIKSVMDAAVADFMSTNEKLESTQFYIVPGVGLCTTATGTATWTMTTQFDEIVAATMNCPASQLPKPQNGGAVFKVEITEKGAVTVRICTSAGVEVTPTPTPTP